MTRTALLAQLASVPGDTAANAGRLARALAEHPDVDIAVFPELYLGGYDLRALETAARPVGCDELAQVAGAAAACLDCGGRRLRRAPIEGGVSRTRSSASTATEDSQASIARLQLFAGEQRERSWPATGCASCSWRASPSACRSASSVEFPEPARGLAFAGAELFVTASANMDPYTGDHELASRARALENRLPHLYVNAVGSPNGLQLVGHDRSIDAGGVVLCRCPERRRGTARRTDRHWPGCDDERVDYLRHLPRALRVGRRLTAHL